MFLCPVISGLWCIALSHTYAALLVILILIVTQPPPNTHAIFIIHARTPVDVPIIFSRTRPTAYTFSPGHGPFLLIVTLSISLHCNVAATHCPLRVFFFRLLYFVAFFSLYVRVAALLLLCPDRNPWNKHRFAPLIFVNSTVRLRDPDPGTVKIVSQLV